ncbi:MAG: DNA-3-methyladenine glycosylase [Alphaproteobacteria bacterium]|nr:DNA-3-methyladenine glycosylase [Alphaproteobacteria bacterium]
MEQSFNGASLTKMIRLARSFFEQGTLTVAQELIGARLHFKNHSGIITETEAYIGKDDPACHAAKGLTQRTQIMFGAAAYSYVYLIYGMYHCLNIVTEIEGFPAAVLIRGVICDTLHRHLDGPGKLCKAWGITKEHNAIDLCSDSTFNVSAGFPATYILNTPRIGIKVGTEHLWRFIMSPADINERLLNVIAKT